MKFNKSSISSFLVVVLSILLAFMCYNFYDYKQDQNEDLIFFKKEKNLLLAEIKDISNKYDTARFENSNQLDDISNYKEKIKNLEEKLSSNELDYKSLLSFRSQLNFLKKERDLLFKITDSLKVENSILVEENISAEKELSSQKNITSELINKNKEYKEAIEKASLLKVNNIDAKGIRIRTSGSLIDTYRAENAERIKVTFTIEGNLFAEKGDKTFYIQILDPKTNIIGERKKVMFIDNADLIYSKKEIIDYNNESYNVSIFVNKNSDEKLIPGLYFISVFMDNEKLGTTSLTLK